MALKTIEDIERAAWFARMAFGIYEPSEEVDANSKDQPESAFYVIP